MFRCPAREAIWRAVFPFCIKKNVKMLLSEANCINKNYTGTSVLKTNKAKLSFANIQLSYHHYNSKISKATNLKLMKHYQYFVLTDVIANLWIIACDNDAVAIQVLLCYRVQAGERLMSWLNYSTTVAIPWLQLQHLLLFSEVLVQCQCDLLWRLNVKHSVHSTKNKTHQNKKSLYNQ